MSIYCVPDVGLGAPHAVQPCRCSLEVYSLVGELGMNQNTLQGEANEAMEIIVLSEEEVESDLVLLTK